MQGNFKYPRIKKIHQMLEKITSFDKKTQNPLCLIITRIFVYKNVLHINLHILYLLFISRQIPKSKNYQNPTSTSKNRYKTIYIILFKLFSIDSFQSKATRKTRLI